MKCIREYTTPALLLLATAFAASPAHAQRVEVLDWLHDVRITRGTVAGDPVVLEGRSTACSPQPIATRPLRVTFRGSVGAVVEIPIETTPLCSGHAFPIEFAFQLGEFPPGDTVVRVFGVDAGTPDTWYEIPASSGGQLQVRAAALAAAGQFRSAHSGMWSVDGRPGEGVLVNVLEQGTVFAYLGKQANGTPQWLISEPIAADDDRGALYAPNPQPGSAPIAWGEITIDAVSADVCRPLRLSLQQAGQPARTLALSKLYATRGQQTGCSALPLQAAD